LRPKSHDTEETAMTSQDSFAPGSTADYLTDASRAKVFFGHQSVGMNLLDGVSAVYAAHGLAAPVIAQDRAPAGGDGGFIDHAFIGENEKPQLKIADFDAKMRAGTGGQVDVALMKFCYVDVTDGTDADALFARYASTIAALERDFPRVAFVHVTVPLTTQQARLSQLKSRLTGNTRFGPAENAARERINALIRQEYAGAHLFDLAEVESTAPDGSRVAGASRGHPYYHLYPGYASDSGHLNRAGSRIAATAWLRAVAQAAPK
jgi:hypothetical protein